jgi:predicted XRE-type DNA-binding protein
MKLSKQAIGTKLGRPPAGITQSAAAKLLDVTRARVNHLCRDGILHTLSNKTIAAESLRTYMLKRVTRQNLALKNGGRQ